MLSDRLYSIDKAGRLRFWQFEVEEDKGRWCTRTGLVEGKETISGWTTCTPKSQKTAGLQAIFEANAEFTKKAKRDWHLTEEGARNSDFVKPMLARTFDKWLGPCMGQPKLDGVRMLNYRKGLWTRTGEPIIAVPHIEAELRDLQEENPSLMLDGELYNHDLHDDLDEISGMSRKKIITPEILQATKKLQYHVYDCPSIAASYPERHEELTHCIKAAGYEHLRIVPYTVLPDEEAFAEYCTTNLSEKYEGTMLRFESEGYDFGARSASLYKVKKFITEEFILIDIEEGNGNWAGRAKRAIIQLPNGNICEAGMRGDFEFAKHLFENKKLYIGGEVTVQYFRYTKDGMLNLPVVIDFHRYGR